MNLRSRIILGYILLVVSSFSIIIYLILKDVRPRYLEAVEESTVDTSELLAAMISQQLVNNEIQVRNVDQAMSAISKRSFLAKIYGIEKQKVSLVVYVTDQHGKLLYDSTGKEKPRADFSKWNDIFLTLEGKYGARSTRTVADDPTSSIIYVAAPIKKNGQIVGVVSVGKPKNSVSFFVDIARKKFFLLLVLIGLSAIGFAILLSSWITQPIRRLIEYINSIRQGKSERLPELGSSEIATLGLALEEMRTKLEGKNYIEDYIRNLTHEMKSPLTAIKGANEILRDETESGKRKRFLDHIDNETSRLQNLVERMLELSRLENVSSVNVEVIQVKQLVSDIIASFSSQADSRKISVETHIPDDFFLKGDQFLIRQAIGNLLANSIDFSPEYSSIQIDASERIGSRVISVRDYGPGIPNFAVSKVFDKFFSLERPSTGKKSTGLGLPFVKEVLTLHGGAVHLKKMDPGLQVELVFVNS